MTKKLQKALTTIGTRVKIRKDSIYYVQAPGRVGVIFNIEGISRGWVRVAFRVSKLHPCGYKNGYRVGYKKGISSRYAYVTDLELAPPIWKRK